MKYANLGGTGVSVSRICLGMMTYGSKQWRDWVLDYADAKPFVARAIEAGINFFDTADVYSNGASEEVLGRALQRDRRRSPRRRHRDEVQRRHASRRAQSVWSVAQEHHRVV